MGVSRQLGPSSWFQTSSSPNPQWEQVKAKRLINLFLKKSNPNLPLHLTERSNAIFYNLSSRSVLHVGPSSKRRAWPYYMSPSYIILPRPCVFRKRLGQLARYYTQKERFRALFLWLEFVMGETRHVNIKSARQKMKNK